MVVPAAKAGRNDEGLAVMNEADVADEGFIEDLVDDRALMRAARGQATELGTGSDGELGHAAIMTKPDGKWQKANWK